MNVVPWIGEVAMLVTGNDLSDLQRDIYITKYSRSHQPPCNIFSDICISFPEVTYIHIIRLTFLLWFHWQINVGNVGSFCSLNNT